MKPRFSILWLIILTTYAAMAAAGIAFPASWGTVIEMFAAIAVLCLSWMSFGDGATAWFARGALGIATLAAVPGTLLLYIATSGFKKSSLYGENAYLHAVLLSGLIGGCVALRRYRVLERRKKKEKSGE